MNNFIKNVLLIATALILSYFTAEYFGALYDQFAPLYDNTLGLGKETLRVFAGIPFAFIFFIILILKLFGSGNRNMWIGWLLVIPGLFFVAGDLRHIYLPIALGLIAFALAKLLQKLFR